MKDLGITEGKWRKHTRYPKTIVAVDAIGGTLIVGNKKDNELTIDAGNTAQECGLLPSELLKQRDELLYALKLLKASYAMYDNLLNFDVSIALTAIKNATK